MARKAFWRGFTVGAAAGVAGAVIPQLVGGSRSRIVRLEKSIQIGRPVEQVFNSWVEFQNLPQISDTVTEAQKTGTFSRWAIQVNGQQFAWEAEIEQFVPNQAIGWKSIRGPKHTGRINFGSIGKDTLVHVVMNYAPPSRLLRPFVAPMAGQIESLIEKVLRDFKASMEGSARTAASGSEASSSAVRATEEKFGPGTSTSKSTAKRATGTLGASPERVDPRFGDKVNPVDYTRPPEAKA